MADSKRQKIISKIVVVMQTILIANGYETNIGTTVRDWEVNFQDDELPAISVCDLIEEVNEDDSPNEGYYYYRLPVQIRIFLKEENRAAQCRKAIADVLKAIKVNRTWIVSSVPLADQTELKRSGFVIAEDAFKIEAAAVEIEILYYTREFDAYE